MPWYILILIAAFILGIFFILQKKGLKKSDPISFTFLFSLIAAIYSLPILIYSNPFIFDNKTIILLAVKSLFAAIFFILSAKALKKMEISEYSPLLNLSPLLLLVISFLFLGERVDSTALIGIIFIVAGSYILELKDGLLSPIKSVLKNKYIHWLLTGMIFASICAVIDRYLLNGSKNIWEFFILNNWFIVFALFPFAVFRKKGISKLSKSFKGAWPFILIGALLYLAGDFIYFSTLVIPAALISLVIPIKRLSTLVSTVVGGEILKERGILRKAIACIVMIIGVYLIAI